MTAAWVLKAKNEGDTNTIAYVLQPCPAIVSYTADSILNVPDHTLGRQVGEGGVGKAQS